MGSPGPCAVLFGAGEELKSTGCSCSTASPKSSLKWGWCRCLGREGIVASYFCYPQDFGWYSWIPARELHILSGGYSPSPSVFLSLLPTLFPAAESWEEREVPLGDADQAGIPERRQQSQGHPPSVRILLLLCVPWELGLSPPSTLPRQTMIFCPFSTPLPPTHLSPWSSCLLTQLITPLAQELALPG